MSTTALSNAVGKLEASLGVRLFNRTTRSVSLTDAGRVFVEQVGPALQDIHGAMEAVRSQQATPSGTLRINAFATAAREILSPLVLEFLRRYPQVHVDLVTEGRLVDIVAEGFDLGVRVADLVPSDMIAVSLGRPQRYAVVGSPAYFEKHGRPRVPPDLLNHPCIRVRLPNGALYRWQFEKGGQTAQIDVSGPITLDEASLARTAVLEGIGLGFFMEQDVRSRHRGGTPRSRAGGLDAALRRALPLLSRTAQPLGRPQGVHRPGPRTQFLVRPAKKNVGIGLRKDLDGLHVKNIFLWYNFRVMQFLRPRASASSRSIRG